MDKEKNCNPPQDHESEHNRNENGMEVMRCKKCGEEEVEYEDSTP